MLQFFYNTAPNPMKVALLLEELEITYEAIPVETRKGQQFEPKFLAINPNGKVPAVVDGSVSLFDSNAILLYLADREQKFIPTDLKSPDRAKALSWLMFIASGIGPFSGQSVHFRHAAPDPKEYALNRYDFEAHRHWKLLDDHLSKNTYMLGVDYSSGMYTIAIVLIRLVATTYQAGDSASPVAPNSHASTNWVDPPNRLTPTA